MQKKWCALLNSLNTSPHYSQDSRTRCMQTRFPGHPSQLLLIISCYSCFCTVRDFAISGFLYVSSVGFWQGWGHFGRPTPGEKHGRESEALVCCCCFFFHMVSDWLPNLWAPVWCYHSMHGFHLPSRGNCKDCSFGQRAALFAGHGIHAGAVRDAHLYSVVVKRP